MKIFETKDKQNFERVCRYMSNHDDFKIISARGDDWNCKFKIEYESNKTIVINKYDEMVIIYDKQRY